MEIPWKRCVVFSHLINGVNLTGTQMPGWIRRHPQKTKFHYAIKRVMDQILRLNESKAEEQESLQIDHALTGEHGELLYNPDGSYAMTPEKRKEYLTAARKLADSAVEIDPFFAVIIPEDLSETELDIFEGFVINKEDTDKYRERFYQENELDESDTKLHAVG